MAPRFDHHGLVGTIVDGRYRIESVAGVGGHGIVYRALQVALNVPLALKVLRSADSTDTAEQSSMDLQTEAQLLFRMCSLHPTFVQAKDTGQLVTRRGTLLPYLVLEWLDGVSLAEELRARRACGRTFQLREVVALLDAPSRGLAMAHARGISHRDLKPGNLFLVYHDRCPALKVLDFGLAKLQGCATSTTSRFANSRQGARAFTPAYAAPEQWLQRLGATGTWTDVHAWALLCSELLSGRAPFRGDSDEQFMAACLDESYRPTPGTLGVSIPDQVEEVFARALAIDPRARFRDLGSFWEALCHAVPNNLVTVHQAVSLVTEAPSHGVAAGQSELSAQHAGTDVAMRNGPPSHRTESTWQNPNVQSRVRRATMAQRPLAFVAFLLLSIGLTQYLSKSGGTPSAEPPGASAVTVLTDVSKQPPLTANPIQSASPVDIPSLESPPTASPSTRRRPMRKKQLPLATELAQDPLADTIQPMPSSGNENVPAQTASSPTPTSKLDTQQLISTHAFSRRR